MDTVSSDLIFPTLLVRSSGLCPNPEIFPASSCLVSAVRPLRGRGNGGNGRRRDGSSSNRKKTSVGLGINVSSVAADKFNSDHKHIIIFII